MYFSVSTISVVFEECTYDVKGTTMNQTSYKAKGNTNSEAVLSSLQQHFRKIMLRGES